MSDTDDNPPPVALPTTVLSEWLSRSKKTANKLATELGVTPRSIYALARGDSELLSVKTLIAVSNYTGLNIDDLVRPYYNAQLAIDAGDSRFNHMLHKIGLYMHSNRCEKKLAPYVSPSFRCGGSEYTKKNQTPMSFKEMCVVNSSNTYDIKNILISTFWYNTGTTRPTQSRTLHTYWRAFVTDREAQTTSDTTFIVLELEKSIEEMEDSATHPQIWNWWWHRPVEVHVDVTERRTMNIEQFYLKHRKIAAEQFFPLPKAIGR